MRKVLLSLVGAAALTAASGANAGVTLGTTGQSQGTADSVTTSITDNTNIPNKIEFDTTNAAAGLETSWFDFAVSYDSTGVFSVTTATDPGSQVTLLDIQTGQPLYATLVKNATGNSYSLQLTSDLLANTWYRFYYTEQMSTPGNISGTASFYARAVPEPATWALMLLGFAGVGFAMRRTRKPAFAQVA